ncbi:MAG: hypothetical protein LIP01_05090 [Tannerellaceae bacterium]|nr:hypothetical protein [Tannerellaceae bacterium]
MQSINTSVDIKQALLNSGVVVTETAWNDLFPTETTDYTIQNDYSKDKTYQTNGILNSMKRTAYQTYFPHMFSLLSKSDILQRGWLNNEEITFRVTPGEDKDFPEKFKQFMKGRSASGNTYITTITSMEELKREAYLAWGGKRRPVHSNTFHSGIFYD